MTDKTTLDAAPRDAADLGKPRRARATRRRSGGVNFLGPSPLDQMNRTIGKLATPGGMLPPSQRLF